MKKLRVLLLLALTSAFILTGCGAKEEETPVPDETVEEQPIEEIEETPSAEDEIVEDDQIPDGMARSPLTGEIEDKEIAKQRPLACSRQIKQPSHSMVSDRQAFYMSVWKRAICPVRWRSLRTGRGSRSLVMSEAVVTTMYTGHWNGIRSWYISADHTIWQTLLTDRMSTTLQAVR